MEYLNSLDLEMCDPVGRDYQLGPQIHEYLKAEITSTNLIKVAERPTVSYELSHGYL